MKTGKIVKSRKMMKTGTKAAAAAVCLVLGICTLFGKAYAAESKWDIEHTLDAAECKQGGTLLLSVTLKGESKTKTSEMTSLSGILEYDTSLFSVGKNDILPAERDKDAVKECTFDAETGKFMIQYASKVTIKDADALLQIRLHVADDATTGNTTVCVTNMEWSGPDDKDKQEIEHRIPSHITIQASKTAAAGDVNGDGRADLTDARLMMQYYNGADVLDSQQQKNADVNGDGKINLTDVKLVMQYYNGETDELVTGQQTESVM